MKWLGIQNCLRRMALIAIVSVLSFPHSGHAQDTEIPRKVVIIGLDGCRFDAIEAAQTPNFDLILSRSAWSKNTRILPPDYSSQDSSVMTSHGPGWASVLSGVWHDRHHVKNDSFTHLMDHHHAPASVYDIESESGPAHYPFIFERLQNAGSDYYTASLTTWPAINHFIGAKADRQEEFSGPGTSPFLTDQRAANRFTHLLSEEDAPDFTFLLFSQINSEGQRGGYGPENHSYLARVETIDGLVGQVVKSISERVKSVKEEWLILITSDHGGDGTHHHYGFRNANIEQTFLIAFGPSIEPGEMQGETYIVDVAAMAMEHLGFVIESLQPSIDGVIPSGPDPELADILNEYGDKIDQSLASIKSNLGIVNSLKAPLTVPGEVEFVESSNLQHMQFEWMTSGLTHLESAAIEQQKLELGYIMNVFKYSLFFIIPVFLFSFIGVIVGGIIHGKCLDSTVSFFFQAMNPAMPFKMVRNSLVRQTDPANQEDFSWIEKEDFNDQTSPEYVAAYKAYKQEQKAKSKKWFFAKKSPKVQIG